MKFFALVLFLLCGLNAQAAPPASENKAIEHLLAFVQASKLTFIRNGEERGAAEAAEHLRAKYERMKDKITSAEDFIEKAASKNLLSGKPYLVKLPDGTSKPVAEWLTDELNRFRQNPQKAH